MTVGHQWIIAVLDDLRTYAALNGLTALAASVEQAGRIARDEVALAEAARAEGVLAHGAGFGGAAGAAGGGAHAR
jgi:hypothetical protein